MNLYKQIVKNEVFAAIGCTEPASCAYCAAIAAQALGESFEDLRITVDPGTLKNGAGVVVPFAQGQKGNLIAAVLGALLADPSKKLELLSDITENHLQQAHRLITDKKCSLSYDEKRHGFFIEVSLRGPVHHSRCILQGGHTRLFLIEKDGKTVFCDASAADAAHQEYRTRLGGILFGDLLRLVENLDDEDNAYIQEGIKTNLELAKTGETLQKTSFQLQTIHRKGYLAKDIFFIAKSVVAAAIDARMSGIPQAAMTSGGSGNQGILTFLVCHLVGRQLGIDDRKIAQSIALAHVVNSYTKSYLGEISVMCGCAISSGLAAAVALVYQKFGADLHKMNLAVSNVIGDLSGLICDGAKPGCAFKAVTSVDSTLRAFFMAAEGFGLSMDDGLIGHNAQQSIENMSRVTMEGMFRVDLTVLEILKKKAME